jgi:hypothetical protein
MKVRRPLWLEQPEKPRSRYQRENRLTSAWAVVRAVRLRRHHEGRRASPGGRLAQVPKGRPQFPVKGDDPAAAFTLAGYVREVDGVPDLAVRGRRHVPRQEGDLLRPEPSLYGQQQDHTVPMGIAGAG